MFCFHMLITSFEIHISHLKSIWEGTFLFFKSNRDIKCIAD